MEGLTVILRQVPSHHRYYGVKLGKHSRAKDPAEAQCIADLAFEPLGSIPPRTRRE